MYNVSEFVLSIKGEVLIKEGDTDQTVYVVLDGQIRIVKDMQGQAKAVVTNATTTFFSAVSCFFS